MSRPPDRFKSKEAHTLSAVYWHTKYILLFNYLVCHSTIFQLGYIDVDLVELSDILSYYDNKDAFPVGDNYE